MQKWVEIRKGGNFQEIGNKYGISPVLARLLINRDVKEEDIPGFLSGGLECLGNPHGLKDMDKAAMLLKKAVEENKRIRVIGDYDVDGICSSYILEQALKDCYMSFHGQDNNCIDTVLPHRVRDGYGMNVSMIDRAIADGVEVIVTCDNGISAKEEIEYACSKGIMVIVTDHHEVPYHTEGDRTIYELPNAAAIIDPKQKDCPYPFKDICGAFVAYKMAQVLYELFKLEQANDFIEMAAMATVADVMPLVNENRALVKTGLERIKNTANMGLQALMKATGLDTQSRINCYDLNFILAPSLNAAGRLDDAMVSRMLLSTRSKDEAQRIAMELRVYNEERKEMTEEGIKKGIAYIDSMETIPDVLVVYLPDCHESVAGIIAGRLREKYNRPVLVATACEEGIKGSGRSIEEYDLHAGMIKCRELFSKFGGHKMAAGFSMSASTDEERLGCVRRLLDEINKDTGLSEEDFYIKVAVDMELPFSYISEALVNELEMLEPCGTGNRKPVFAAKNVTLKGGRVLGKKRNVYKAQAIDATGRGLDMLIFGDGAEIQNYVKDRASLLLSFYPDVNEYNGVRTLQIKVGNYK